MVVSSPFICSNNNKRLDRVISKSVFKKVRRNKSSVSIKIIYFLHPDIGFDNKRLDADVSNNVLLKLEES